MLSKLMTFLLAAREPADDGNKFTKILPFVIIMILYALSSLFKNKGQKPKPSQQPKPANRQQTSRPQPLPGYARKSREIQRQQGQPARSSTTRELPSRPTQQQIPGSSKPLPYEYGRESAQPTIQPASRRDAAQTKAAMAQRIRATAKRHSADLKLSQRQMQSVGESKRIRGAAKTSQDESRVKETTAADFLEDLMRDENTLARAVIYSEIIGKPLFFPTKNTPPGLESIM